MSLHKHHMAECILRTCSRIRITSCVTSSQASDAFAAELYCRPERGVSSPSVHALARAEQDIRLFWTSDQRFQSQFKAGTLSTFKAYSKYPPCFKVTTLLCVA